MVQNTLKRRARAFAATHSVPYLTALHAVDEPLHELRDLFRLPENFEVGFHIIPREGSYGPAYTLLEERDRVKALGGLELKKYLVESGRRISLIEESGAKDIWGYREIYRAGILPEGSPALEPLFHHYQIELQRELRSMFSIGRELGIYPVNLSRQLYIRDRFCFRPVTEIKLAALKAGTLAGPIEKRVFSVHNTERAEDVVEPFGTLATWGNEEDRSPRAAVLVKGGRDEAIRELEARDLPSKQFTFQDVSKREVTVRDLGTLHIFLDGYEAIWGSTDRILVIR